MIEEQKKARMIERARLKIAKNEELEAKQEEIKVKIKTHIAERMHATQ
jgi:hypothetical protein